MTAERRCRSVPGWLRRTVLLIVMCFAEGVPASASDDFVRYGVDDGLPSTTAYGLAQDQKGFLWVSGASGGLARFDGYEFQYAALINAEAAGGDLPDTGVLLRDAQDQLWVGTWGQGLMMLKPDRKSVVRYRHATNDDSSLPSDRVQSLHLDREGSIWVGTTEGLARVLPDGRLVRMSDVSGGVQLRDARVWSIAGSIQDDLWVGSSDGLYRFRSGSGQTEAFQPFPVREAGPRGNEVRVLYRTDDGLLWLGTRKGLVRFDPATATFTVYGLKGDNPEAGFPPINSIIGLPKGDLLLGTREGIYRFNPASGRFIPFSDADAEPATLPSADIRQLLLDRSGALWAASRDSGLYQTSPLRQQFSGLSAISRELTPEEIKASVSAVHKAADGVLWVGSNTGVLGIDTGTGKVSHLLDETGNPVPGAVTAILGSADGTLWVATEAGLFRRSPGSRSLRAFDAPFLSLGLQSPSVRALSLTTGGQLLIGLWGEGALRWDPATRRSEWLLKDFSELAGDAVFALQQDSRGVIWIGTRYSGLYQVSADARLLQHYQAQPGEPRSPLPSNTVQGLFWSSRDELWICTDQGLVRHRPDTGAFKTLTQSDGLPDNKIVGAIEDRTGNLWVLSKRGLVRIADEGRDLMTFSRPDGLASSEINRMSVDLDPQGNLYVGTVEGLSFFNINRLATNTTAPLVAITGASIDNQAVARERFETGTVTVPSGARSVSFTLASLDFHDVDRNHFRYRLHGLDEQWQPLFRGHIATFNDLPPGRYQLEVVGSNSHGRWSEQPARLQVVIEGPWWKHPGAQLALVIGLIGLALAGYRWRVSQMEAARLRLEETVESYAGELRAERDLFVGGPVVALMARATENFPITFVSANAATVLGYAPEEMMADGFRLLELVHPEDRPGIMAAFVRLIGRQQSHQERRFRLIRRDGALRWMQAVTVAQSDNSGRVTGLRGYLLDQTDLIASQQEAQQFKGTLDRTLDGVLVFGADDLTLSYVNQGARSLLGYPSEQLLGRHFWDIETGRGEVDFRMRVAPLLAGEKPFLNYEGQCQRANGSAVPVEIFLQYIAPEGEAARFVVIISDITERHRIDRMKSEFVSTVSHELRTPLTSISGSLGLMVGGALGEFPAQAKPLLEIAYRNARQLTTLINDLLDMDKIIAGKMEFEVQSQLLSPLLVQTLEANQPYAIQLGVRLRLDAACGQARVPVDGRRLVQVLTNLLSNACKYSPAGGEVVLSAQVSVAKVRINVTDYGPGVPQAFHARVFEKFSQADASDTRAKGGTGLGLAITKELVERMGGVIGFDSVEGQGATFWVELPLDGAA